MFYLLPSNWSPCLDRYWQWRYSTRYDCDQCLLWETHSISKMPDYLRFNPWILSGYRRADLSTLQCLLSIGHLHNETINIMTHCLPILYVLFNYSTLFNSALFGSYLTYCHIISCLTPWIGSVTYHVFMNHRLGIQVYQKLLQLDMLGIWITQTFGALTTITASFIAFSATTRSICVFLYLVLSAVALYKGITAHYAWQRPLSFTLLFLVRVTAFIIRIGTHHQLVSTYQAGHILNVVMQEIWPILGALISVARIPERFFPGQFDLCCNSHNIMHCMVVLGAIHMHLAFLADLNIVLLNS